MSVATAEQALAKLEPLGEERLTSRRGEPVWELAYQFPLQGEWTEADYLSLDTNQLIELTDGMLEFLPMVSPLHQDIVGFLWSALQRHVEAGGEMRAYFAPLRLRLSSARYREPDVVLASRKHVGDRSQPLVGAELVMEVVSGRGGDRRRDTERKRSDYALAGIPEYWIVDPATETITVLTLPTGAAEYAVYGEFKSGEQARSALLAGFSVDVRTCFAAGNLGQTTEDRT